MIHYSFHLENHVCGGRSRSMYCVRNDLQCVPYSAFAVEASSETANDKILDNCTVRIQRKQKELTSVQKRKMISRLDDRKSEEPAVTNRR